MNTLPENQIEPTELSDLLIFEQPVDQISHPMQISKQEYFKYRLNRFLAGIKIELKNLDYKKRGFWFLILILSILCLNIVFYKEISSAPQQISTILNMSQDDSLKPLVKPKQGYEVFGFAPYWTFNKLDNVDFSTLTTFSYFGVEVDGEGNLDKSGQGYKTFMSEKATEIFKKAHSNGTRVVLTITQMKNDPIKQLMDNPVAQEKVIADAVAEVKNRGIDGINVDLEYTGNPGSDYRSQFSVFVKNLTDRMHQEVPNSKVTVSVYASAVKDPKIYDIGRLADVSDGIFMMAYDFAVAGSDNAIPTAPLYGHKEGKYWYDVSTAVEHFLAQMPAEKLILGVPWYGYNYAVQGEPQVKASTNKGYYAYYKKGRRTYSYWVPIRSHAQTYTIVQNEVNESEYETYKSGWDEYGQVGWRAYNSGGSWRMVFIDDPKSLSLKYDFAKEKKLGGVGMWALGFDNGKTEMWALLKEKFGQNELADNAFVNKEIH